MFIITKVCVHSVPVHHLASNVALSHSLYWAAAAAAAATNLALPHRSTPDLVEDSRNHKSSNLVLRDGKNGLRSVMEDVPCSHILHLQ